MHKPYNHKLPRHSIGVECNLQRPVLGQWRRRLHGNLQLHGRIRAVEPISSIKKAPKRVLFCLSMVCNCAFFIPRGRGGISFSHGRGDFCPARGVRGCILFVREAVDYLFSAVALRAVAVAAFFAVSVSAPSQKSAKIFITLSRQSSIVSTFSRKAWK